MADSNEKKDDFEEAFYTPRDVKTAEVEVVIGAKRIASEVEELEREVNRYHDWGDATNEEIEEAMRNTDEWKNRLCKIQDKIYAMEKNVQLYNLSSVELMKSTSMFEDLKNDMKIAIRDIKEEDDARGIYTLSTSTVADVELPKFGGKSHENFIKFKTEMSRGFKSNKVRREDQINKLRKNLFDQPKTMIPCSMKSIKDAWKILDDLYGDSVRFMNSKLHELKSLRENPDGGYPMKGRGVNLLKAQIDWITRLEVILNEVTELGEQSKQLDRDAFCSRTLASVLSLFPFEMQDALEREIGPAKEDGKERMHFIIQYLRDLRRIRQGILRTEELSLESSRVSKEKDVISEQIKLKNEILETRQKVYSKLNEGKNVLSIMKRFKSKVEMLLRKYKADLSFEEEKHWRDKIIITEKAVVRRSKELKAAKESCSRKVKHLAPSVQEIFDAAKAQELIIETIPEPPDVDEIEVKLKRLKKFNKKLLNAQVSGKRKRCEEKLVSNENDGDMSSNDATEKYNEEVVDKNKHGEGERIYVNDFDEKYQAEVNEFNAWYYKKLDERRKVAYKTTKDVYDKIAPSTDSVYDKNDETMYKQVVGGKCNEDKVDKSDDASKIVTLLQAIFAMMLVTGKTVHEQSLQINRVSKLSQPSLLSHQQPEASLSPRSTWSRQSQPRACCKVINAFAVKVSSMVNAASSGVVWCNQAYGAFECVKKRTVKAAMVRLVNLLCYVTGLDLVTLQLAGEDYKVKVKVH